MRRGTRFVAPGHALLQALVRAGALDGPAERKAIALCFDVRPIEVSRAACGKPITQQAHARLHKLTRTRL